MHSLSILKTIAFTCIAIATLLVKVDSHLCAQDFFNGRGIAGAVNGSSPSFSGPFGTSQIEQPANNPIAGIFKKPAFLQNLKLPGLGGNNQSSGLGFLSNLPKLSNLIPQRDPGQLSMLGKMKAKTDAFFAKASALEKLIPGRQSSTQDVPEWDAVRQTMEATLASEARQATGRTANAVGSTLQR